uniref:Outer dense fiber protein 3-like n=1 Tax=Echeneis naucrates TaxID=173247 RepID=A0A665UVU9_ECHNA
MGSAEPWVGTWRPHKPRGPIAALYGSPGPKYALPGLTGINKHDPTKYKAPQFSLGKVHKQISSDCSPGPRYLNVRKSMMPYIIIIQVQNCLTKAKAPSFSFGLRHSEYITPLFVNMTE